MKSSQNSELLTKIQEVRKKPVGNTVDLKKVPASVSLPHLPKLNRLFEHLVLSTIANLPPDLKWVTCGYTHHDIEDLRKQWEHRCSEYKDTKMKLVFASNKDYQHNQVKMAEQLLQKKLKEKFPKKFKICELQHPAHEEHGLSQKVFLLYK